MGETLKFNGIKRDKDFVEIVASYEEKYGNLISIYMINKERYTKTYSSIVEFSRDFYKFKYSNVATINLTYMNANQECKSVLLDLEKLTITINEISVNLNNVQEESNTNSQEQNVSIEELMTNPEARYYVFDDGVYAKYENHLYYSYNPNTGEWVNDSSILERFYGSNYNFEEIKAKPEGQRR